MAQDTLEIGGIPLQPVGMNDNVPLESDPNFYQTRGIHSLSDRTLQRCNGKKLYHRLPCPVLAIHGGLLGRVLVETSCAIYQFEKLDDDLPNITPAPFPTTGLVLHLESDSLLLNDNDLVSLWDDQSGEDNNATQATPANQPTFKTNILNGLPALRFIGNHRLDTAFTLDFSPTETTIFLLRNNISNPPGLSVDEVVPITNEFLLLTKTIFHHYQPSNFSNLTHQDDPAGFCLQTARFGTTPAELELWLNGIVSNQSIGTNGFPSDYDVVGRSVHIGGRMETPPAFVASSDYVAIMIYNVSLSNADRLAVETYLIDKYGL